MAGRIGLRRWAKDPNVVKYDVWVAYLDWSNYGIGADPGLTDEQIAASVACLGWWS